MSGCWGCGGIQSGLGVGCAPPVAGSRHRAAYSSSICTPSAGLHLPSPKVLLQQLCTGKLQVGSCAGHSIMRGGRGGNLRKQFCAVSSPSIVVRGHMALSTAGDGGKQQQARAVPRGESSHH
jgi:hypothetical protein